LINHRAASAPARRVEAVIKYLGSKRALAQAIAAGATEIGARSAADLFAGTTRVGQALRASAIEVLSNDTAAYSEAFGLAYVAAGPGVDRLRIRRLLRRLHDLPPVDGYVTETFCRRSRYFRPENGMQIDAVRDEIDRLDLDPVERGILLTSLVEAADRVDSTVGVQMAYLKQWAPRAANALELREPAAIAGPPGRVARADANELASALDGIDLAYIDPPYNQHSYLGNYHIWETLVRWDAPDHYGVACKRVDCRTRKSPYNLRRHALPALADLIERARAPWLVVSFSNEGFHRPDEIEALLALRGHVGAVAVLRPRYVGARIGIHDPAGRRVGTVSHLSNTEYLFVCGPDRRRLDRAVLSISRALVRHDGAGGNSPAGRGPEGRHAAVHASHL
jgi:adenine-specific DNA-methyltransferase